MNTPAASADTAADPVYPPGTLYLHRDATNGWLVTTSPDPGREFNRHPPDTGIVVRIDCSGDTAQITEAPDLVGVDEDRAHTVVAFVQQAAEVMHALRYVHRRAVSSPSRFGLVSRRTMYARHRSDWLGAHNRDEIADTLGDTIDRDWLAPDLAWFAPHADPSKFGTLYLAPAEGLDGETSWHLRQVGLGHESQGHAHWSNDTELAKLAARCFDDLELVMTMAALSDPSLVREQAAEHAVRLAIAEARVAFTAKKDRIRPQLVEKIALEAYRTSGYRGWPRSGVHRLLDPTVEWGESTRLTIYAAQSTNFPADMTNEQCSQAALRARDLLDERGLGIVVLVYDPDREPEYSMWITQRPDLLQQHRAAFRIGERAQFTVIPSTRPARTAKAR